MVVKMRMGRRGSIGLGMYKWISAWIRQLCRVKKGLDEKIDGVL